MRIGIFGGTFDPIHNGHLTIAQTALNELPIDKVLFVPAGSPPHKVDQHISAAPARVALVKLAIAGNPAFDISEIEIQRRGPSYTVDTVNELASMYPSPAKLFLIIGADNLVHFEKWRSPEEILAKATLAVYPRYGYEISRVAPRLLERAVILNAPRMEFSSSHIRELLRAGKSIRYLVPDAVEKAISKERYYPAPSR